MKAPLINRALAFIIIGLRPLLGKAQCRFETSCGHYTIKQLNTQPLFKAIWLSAKRILSCSPFGKRQH